MQPWIIYALLAAISAALVGIFSKVGIKGVDATVATSIRGMVIALSMGAFALMYGKWHTLAETDSRALLFIVLAGLFGGLSWLWGFLALQGGGDVTAVNAIDRLSLVFILVFAVLFLGDAFTWMRGLGVFFIFVGILLATLTQEQIASLFAQFKNLLS